MTPPAVQALSEDTLGIALLHIERGDLSAARPLLADAVSGGVSTGANASLFHGAPALEFVLGRTSRPAHRVRAAVDRIAADRLAAARRRRESGALPSLAEFDLIRGLTGMAALLLTRDNPPPLTGEVLRYLASLANPVGVGREGLPGWWTPGSPPHEKTDGGFGDNGIAHGIAGPLAALSIAASRGIRVDGQVDAIGTFTRWLEKHGARYWVTLPEISGSASSPDVPRRPSWCYGALGIARSMQLGAIVTGDTARKQAAEDAAMTALTDPAKLALVTDASLCHGWAGIVTVTRAIAADSALPERFEGPLSAAREHLAAGIGTLAKPGFLEGTSGAQLALDGTNSTGWTRALLID